MEICVLKNEKIMNEKIIFKRNKENNKKSVIKYF